jgi:hypothetical protein
MRRTSIGSIPTLTKAATLGAQGNLPRGLYDPAMSDLAHELEGQLAQAKVTCMHGALAKHTIMPA